VHPERQPLGTPLRYELRLEDIPSKTVPYKANCRKKESCWYVRKIRVKMFQRCVFSTVVYLEPCLPYRQKNGVGRLAPSAVPHCNRIHYLVAFICGWRWHFLPGYVIDNISPSDLLFKTGTYGIGGCTIGILLLYIPVRLYPGRHPLVQPSLLWVLGATGYPTTAVYNPKSDTSAVFRNVGTGVCSVLDRSMGQWGETHTRCWAE